MKSKNGESSLKQYLVYQCPNERSILHDGWTFAGVYYIVLFACYSLEQEQLKQEKKKEPEDDKVQLSLLSVSPMARTELVEDEK